MKKIIITTVSAVMIPVAAWAQSPLNMEVNMEEFPKFSPPTSSQMIINDGTGECPGGNDPFVSFGTRCGIVEKKTIQLMSVMAPASTDSTIVEQLQWPTSKESAQGEGFPNYYGIVRFEAGWGNPLAYKYADFGFFCIDGDMDFFVSMSHGIAFDASSCFQPERGAGMLFRNAWGSANETRFTPMVGYVFRQGYRFSLRLLGGPNYDVTNDDLALDLKAEASGYLGNFIPTARFFWHMNDDWYNTFLTQLEFLYGLNDVARVGVGLDLLSLQDLRAVIVDWRWGMGLSAVANLNIWKNYFIGGSVGGSTMDGFATVWPFGKVDFGFRL